jgi:hypothetical protein
MGFLDLLIHFMNFLAPALAVAVVVALMAPWVMSNRAPALGIAAQTAINFVAGALALGLGLWFFGRDGKMASYCALVLACASSQWWMRRGR